MTTTTIEEQDNNQPARVHQGMELNEYQQIRLEKAEKLRQIGIDPYPPRFKERTHSIAQVLADFDNLSKDEQGQAAKEGVTVTVAGRILGKRDQKVVFADLIEDGERIQLYLKDKNLEAGADGLNLFKETVDLGDIVGISGVPFVTHKGDRTIEVHHWWMLSKAINQPPDKYAGLTDKETRYRQRYIDLMANEDVRDVFIKRSKIITAFRHFLDNQGFMEVETPTLQPLYGGALARPFTTHHNDLDRTFYLRIADELYLKRLLVGGYGKVYEICKDFRNEGIDASHNPEFTMLEFYQAFADYEDIMQLAEQMINYVATETLGTNKFTYRNQDIDLTPPFRRITMQDAIFEYSGIDYQKYPEQADLYQQLKDKGVDVEPDTVWPKLVDEAFKTFVRPKLVQPTFIYDYPQKLSPLAKRKPGQPDTVERFQPIIGGLECGNAFSELNDPFDQRARFLEQKRNEEAGDDEAMQMDNDFINALMHGMPPTGGMGIGIDRIVMLLTNQESVRDVILFPQMRTIE